MAKQTDTGIYQLKNGNWAFRYTLTRDGQKKDVRKAKDEQGNVLKTKSKPPVELVVCEALEGPATGRVSRRTEKFTNRITVTGRR